MGCRRLYTICREDMTCGCFLSMAIFWGVPVFFSVLVALNHEYAFNQLDRFEKYFKDHYIQSLSWLFLVYFVYVLIGAP